MILLLLWKSFWRDLFFVFDNVYRAIIWLLGRAVVCLPVNFLIKTVSVGNMFPDAKTDLLMFYKLAVTGILLFSICRIDLVSFSVLKYILLLILYVMHKSRLINRKSGPGQSSHGPLNNLHFLWEKFGNFIISMILWIILLKFKWWPFFGYQNFSCQS